MTAFNAWTPKGNVITGTAKGNPSVIYDNNSVILFPGTPATFVFKMWYGRFSTGDLFYAESADGLTSWTQYVSNPIASLTGTCYFPTVFKDGSTYYLFADNTETPANIDRWTSPDGVTWTHTNTAVITVGSAGAWDANTAAQVTLCANLAGTWYGYYFGNKAGGLGGLGLVTSTNQGATWTKVTPAAPTIINSNGQPGPGTAAGFLQSGGIYYCYASAYYNNSQLHGQGLSAFFRWSAPSPSGPWTQLTLNGNQVPVYYSASPQDFVDTTGLPNIGDLTIAAANGNVYLYYDLGRGSLGEEGAINQAVATGFTVAQLVATYEGVVNAPISGAPQLNLVTLASDNFQRANGTLGANWTAIATTGSFNAAQIVSNLVERNAAASADSRYSALSWVPDQWSMSTIAAITAANAGAGAAVLMNTSGTASEYTFQWNGILGNSGTVYAIKKVTAGTGANLQAWTTNLVFAVGDTIMGVAVNTGTATRLLFYWNGFIIACIDDATFVAGSAGLQIVANTAANNTQISAWSGGNFTSGTVAIPTSASGTGYMMLTGCGS